jgi:hypothetical protein
LGSNHFPKAALALKRPVAGLSCYIGVVWTTPGLIAVIGTEGGSRLFVPWDNVDGILVTDDDLKLQQFQVGCNQSSVEVGYVPTRPYVPITPILPEPYGPMR